MDSWTLSTRRLSVNEERVACNRCDVVNTQEGITHLQSVASRAECTPSICKYVVILEKPKQRDFGPCSFRTQRDTTRCHQGGCPLVALLGLATFPNSTHVDIFKILNQRHIGVLKIHRENVFTDRQSLRLEMFFRDLGSWHIQRVQKTL